MKLWIYDWQGLNAWLFLQINAIHAPWLDALMVQTSWLGHYEHMTFYAGLIGLVGLLHLRTAARQGRLPAIPAQDWLLHLAVALLGYHISIELIEHMKDIWHLPRPYVALPPEMVVRIDQVLNAKQDWRSFPSGHSGFVASLLTALWPLLRRHWRLPALLFAALMAVSRISLGVHFPADVAYGLFIGFAVTWAVRVGLHACLARAADASTARQRSS